MTAGIKQGCLVGWSQASHAVCMPLITEFLDQWHKQLNGVIQCINLRCLWNLLVVIFCNNPRCKCISTELWMALLPIAACMIFWPGKVVLLKTECSRVPFCFEVIYTCNVASGTLVLVHLHILYFFLQSLCCNRTFTATCLCIFFRFNHSSTIFYVCSTSNITAACFASNACAAVTFFFLAWDTGLHSSLTVLVSPC